MQEIRREYELFGEITIVVYDEEYPDRIELEMSISPDSPYEEIKDKMVDYFGYGGRYEKWSRVFDERAREGMYKVVYGAREYELTEFLSLLRKFIRYKYRRKPILRRRKLNLRLIGRRYKGKLVFEDLTTKKFYLYKGGKFYRTRISGVVYRKGRAYFIDKKGRIIGEGK